MKIQGRTCTLTVAKDNTYIPLPYSEETVRETSKGYVLPAVIGKRNREKYVEAKRELEGCFVTRLDYNCILGLFLLFFNNEEAFDLYADRVYEKIVYKNACIKSFELRAENGEAFKMRVDVGSKDNYYKTSWPVNTPSLEIPSTSRGITEFYTYQYDGHLITIDNKTIPLIYRFELTASYTETINYKLTLYFPLSTEFYPSENNIEKLTIPIDIKDGITLELYDLEPDGHLVDINCADRVLASQNFRINSNIVLTIRNEQEFRQIVL